MAAQSTTPLLKVEGLKQYFRVNKNFTVKAVDDVSFEIYPGETIYHVEVLGKPKTLCPDCFETWARSDLSLKEIAEAFGMKTEVAY